MNFLLPILKQYQEKRLLKYLNDPPLIFCQILSANSLKKFMDNGLENLFADIGAYKKKTTSKNPHN